MISATGASWYATTAPWLAYSSKARPETCNVCARIGEVVVR